ncbi:MAG: Hsp20/alpha crystallin family protein [Vulcanimicrobiaceae bacterium]
MLFQPSFPDMSLPELSLARSLMNTVLPAAEAAAFLPNVEVSEKDGNYIIDVALPGFKREDIDIEVSGNEITITGQYERKEEDTRTHYTEMRQASFTRTLVLPQEIDADKVTASFENGILRITAPSVASISAKHVAISGSEGTGSQTGGSQTNR